MKTPIFIFIAASLSACSQAPIKVGPLPNTAAVRSGLVETQSNIKRTQSGIKRVQEHAVKQESHDAAADAKISSVEQDLDKLLKQ